MSSYHLAPELIPHYLDALKKYRIKFLLGYTSALHAIAQEVQRLGRKDLQMIVAVTNGEPLFSYQRQSIAEAFQCPVRETYGMAEIVAGGSECTMGQLHLWPEVGCVEVFDAGQPVMSGVPGDLICTGLFNSDMPLIRYRVGDRGTLQSDTKQCPCRRSMPVLASVEGRLDDILCTEDGRSIGRLDPVFKADLPLREAQILQESLHQVRVRYVPEAGFTRENGRCIIDRLQARMGPVEVILEKVDKVPRDGNGKFRAVVSMMRSS